MLIFSSRPKGVPVAHVSGEAGCGICGFIESSLRLAPVDGRWRDGGGRPVCSLCYGVLDLSSVSEDDGYRLVWLPEVSQVNLNAFCRAAWAGENGPEDYAHFAADFYERVLDRHSFTDVETNDNLFEWVRRVIVSRVDDLDARKIVMSGFRLVPDRSCFSTVIPRWIEDNFRDHPVESWGKL